MSIFTIATPITIVQIQQWVWLLKTQKRKSRNGPKIYENVNYDIAVI